MLTTEPGAAATVANSQSLVVSDPHGSGWRVSYALSNLGGGLVITGAEWLGIPVLASGAQPFAIVIYRGAPKFKDGIGKVGGDVAHGAAYQPLAHGAPNAPDTDVDVQAAFSGFVPTASALYHGPITESVVNDVVFVEATPEHDGVEPARLTVWAKFQAGNYQYLQRWSFLADGTIEPGMALAGKLLPPSKGIMASGRVHEHNFYFRLHMAFGAGQQQASQLLAAVSSTGGGPVPPYWSPLENATSFTASASIHQRLRVGNAAPDTGADGLTTPSYVIEPANYVPPDGFFSNADFFLMNHVPAELPDSITSSSIPANETLGLRVADTDPPQDHALNDAYAPLGGSQLDGDLLIWHVLREYHVPREDHEEVPVVPYHFDHFTIRSRGILTATAPLSWAGYDPADFLVPGLVSGT